MPCNNTLNLAAFSTFLLLDLFARTHLRKLKSFLVVVVFVVVFVGREEIQVETKRITRCDWTT